MGQLKTDIFQKYIKDSLGFQNQNGESGTSLDPGSRTRREDDDFGENLQSTHCPIRYNTMRETQWWRSDEGLKLAKFENLLRILYRSQTENATVEHR